MVVPARLGALQGRRDGDRRHGVRWPHRSPARRPRHQGEAALGARRTGRGEEGLREGRGPPRDARRTRAPRRPGRLRRAADRDLLGGGPRHRGGGVRAGRGDPRRGGLRLDHRAQLVPAAEAGRPAVPQDGHGHLRRGQEVVLLAGDVGGTKTALALFDRRDGALVLERETELSSREFLSLEDAVARFLASPRRLRIDAACFGVAGPVVDGRSVTTNLPCQIDEATLRARIPARRVRLLNDLEATGYGVLTLPPTALAPLQPGTRRRGTVALIAAGTGLGEALLIWDGQRHLVVASEGGHADFAPRTDLEVELLRFLRKEFGRVSCERVLSGPGLFNIYRFLRDTGDVPEPSWLGDRIARGAPRRRPRRPDAPLGDPPADNASRRQSMIDRYDLLVIGGGAAGINALKQGVKLGARVALVESGPLGGTCINRG